MGALNSHPAANRCPTGPAAILLPEVLEGKPYAAETAMGYFEEGISIVSKTWLGLSGEEGEAVKEWLDSNGYEVSMEYSEDRIIYALALEDEYFRSIEADVFNIGGSSQPFYTVKFSITLTRQES
jgi:hypothetical protein